MNPGWIWGKLKLVKTCIAEVALHSGVSLAHKGMMDQIVRAIAEHIRIEDRHEEVAEVVVTDEERHEVALD